jgi:hypothetical protein
MKRREPNYYLCRRLDDGEFWLSAHGARGCEVSNGLLRMATMPSECELLKPNLTYNLEIKVTLNQQEEQRHERNGKR